MNSSQSIVTYEKSKDEKKWSSWIPGPLSNLVSTAGALSLSALKGLTSPETKEMNLSLLGKLKACDTQLDTLHRQREEASAAYDAAVLATNAVQSQYENNLQFIQEKLEELRKHMLHVIQEMVQKSAVIRSPDHGDAVGVKDDDIIETFHSLMTTVEQLKSPAGTQFSSLFPHIAMDGVKVSVDYAQAVAMNKTILQEVAAKRNEEGPLLKRLEEVKRDIRVLQKEVDLIRDFQMKHARISADQVAVPMVDGAPKALIADDLHIQPRSKVSDEAYPFPPAPPNI